MRKYRFQSVVFLLLLACCSFIPSASHAQQYHGPQDFHGCVKFEMPIPDHYPPVRTDMPLDVIKGYIVLDSIMRLDLHQHQIDSLIEAIGDSDTLRTALKYAYEMIDYDPVAYFQALNMFTRSTGGYLRRAPAGVMNSLLERVGEIIPDSGLMFKSLAHVDAILHVYVDDTHSVRDWTSNSGERCRGVFCDVRDVIKGQNLPGCTDTDLYHSHGKTHYPTGIPSCVAFQYWDHWMQGVQMPTPWIGPGNEYIVFLSFIGLGVDSGKHYATLSPGLAVSSMMGVYAIHDGKVYDPHNDFGFGTGLSTGEFKAKLRGRILSIASYHK